MSTENKEEFEKIKSITLPAFLGQLQILPGYAESFIVLGQGKIIIDGEKTKTIPIENGICDIKNDVATIIL